MGFFDRRKEPAPTIDNTTVEVKDNSTKEAHPWPGPNGVGAWDVIAVYTADASATHDGRKAVTRELIGIASSHKVPISRYTDAGEGDYTLTVAGYGAAVALEQSLREVEGVDYTRVEASAFWPSVIRPDTS